MFRQTDDHFAWEVSPNSNFDNFIDDDNRPMQKTRRCLSDDTAVYLSYCRKK